MENHFTRQTAGGVIFVFPGIYFLNGIYPEWRNMKRRPHKIVSVVLLAVLIAGMGMACRIQSLESRNKRWTENTETAGKILTESGKKEAQKQTNGTENDDAAQNAKRVFGDEPAELYAASAVLMDADSGRVLYGKDADVVRPMASTTKIMTCILALEYLREHPDQTIEVSIRLRPSRRYILGCRKGKCSTSKTCCIL